MSAKQLEKSIFQALTKQNLISGYQPQSGLVVVTNPNSADIADTLRQCVYQYLRRPQCIAAIRETCRRLPRYSGMSLEDWELIGHGGVVQVMIHHRDKKSLPISTAIGQSNSGVILYIYFCQSLALDINSIANQVAALLRPHYIGAFLL